jgi:transcriptional regulator with XRE-family HTH domain
MGDPTVPKHVVSVFSTALRDTMVRRGLTQAQLARMVGVHQKTVSCWLSGKQFPMPKSAFALAEALDTPKLGELGVYRVECAWKGCSNLAEYNPKGGHPSKDVWCSVKCYRKWRWVTKTDPARRKRRRESYKALTAISTKAIDENRDLKERIRQNCEDCAGLGSPCPLIEGCVFIPVTHLLVRREREGV